jgi:hypothetical protein
LVTENNRWPSIERLPKKVMEQKTGETWNILKSDRYTVILSNGSEKREVQIAWLDYDLREGRYSSILDTEE